MDFYMRAGVASQGHGQGFLAEIAASHRNGGERGDEIAEDGGGRDDVEIFEVAEVAGAVLAFGGRGVFRHVLGEDVARRNAFDEERADVADHRGHPVFFLEGGGAADGDGLLAEAGVETADDFVLAEEAGHGVLDFAIEAHEVVEVEVLLARKFRFDGCCGGRHLRRFSGWTSGCLSYGERGRLANWEDAVRKTNCHKTEKDKAETPFA